MESNTSKARGEATPARGRIAPALALFMLATMLPGCGALRDDPLGIHDMLDRCRRAAEEGRREFVLPPVLPVFGCRI